MSSTNRSGGTGGEAEFYGTPHHAVWRLDERMAEVGRRLPGGSWLEVGAGEGDIVRAWRKVRDDVRWTAVELRAECRGALEECADEVVIAPYQRAFEAFAAEGRTFDVACFNPPFSHALAIVRALFELRLARRAVCLQRTPWIADAADRYDYFRDKVPDDWRIGRLDFDGGGGDSIPYSWFDWTPADHPRTEGRLVLLRPTPPEERVRGKVPPARQGALF